MFTGPPDQPRTVTVENVGATWVQISWDSPLVVEFPISYYEILARAGDSVGEIIRNISTPDNRTFVNVTALLPGTTYNFTVAAVIRGGNVISRGPESLPLQDVSTEFSGKCACVYSAECCMHLIYKINVYIILSYLCIHFFIIYNIVPEILCPMPESMNGNIVVSWSYVHTGGLPLTGLSVNYTYEEGTSTVTNSVDVDTNDMRVTVSGLVTGREYTFTVTAYNANGSNSTVCIPVDHRIGKIYYRHSG